MANKKISVRGAALAAKREDKKFRDTLAKSQTHQAISTVDSFTNFAQRMGVGADNALSTAGYGFNPITRVRTTLEWIHRGSWLGGVAVDVVADDMTRAGVELLGEIEPQDMEAIEREVVDLQIWNKLNENIKWSRLYGGSIAVLMIDGQDMSTPLRLETVGKDQFKGLLVLDRWMVQPSLENLVTDQGPYIGLPKFYTITADAPALPRVKIHYSRVIRQIGIELPYWQKLQENLWGISVLERLYDRMIAFDSATTGAAQLVYKSYIRTYKIKGLREVIAAGGAAMNGLSGYVELMRRFQGVEGITLMDGEDEFAEGGSAAFSGLADALTQFGQQLSGALQIPLVRLFGQSPAGFGNGDNDVRLYYDNIKQQQEKDLRIGVTKVYKCAAASKGIKLPDSFRVEFRSLWQLSEKEKAEIAETTQRTVSAAQEAGLVSDKVAMQELRQSSRITGIFTNISEDDISKVAEEIEPPIAEGLLPDAAGKEPLAVVAPAQQAQQRDRKRYRDSGHEAVANMFRLHGLQVVVENPKGSIRRGGVGEDAWEAIQPADYGYVRMATGADGDQVDIYVGPDHSSKNVYIIDQIDLKTKLFDEHKCMLAFGNEGAAMQCYVEAFTDGLAADRIGLVHSITMDQFRHWLAVGDCTKPFGANK